MWDAVGLKKVLNVESPEFGGGGEVRDLAEQWCHSPRIYHQGSRSQRRAKETKRGGLSLGGHIPYRLSPQRDDVLVRGPNQRQLGLPGEERSGLPPGRRHDARAPARVPARPTPDHSQAHQRRKSIIEVADQQGVWHLTPFVEH